MGQGRRKAWKQAALFILDGRGAGQWRDIVANHGRAWEIDRPFDVAPDATSVATIVTFNGRVLIIGNQFEDGNWVNAGYGMSIDVIWPENHLARCADLMNYGLHGETLPALLACAIFRQRGGRRPDPRRLQWGWP